MKTISRERAIADNLATELLRGSTIRRAMPIDIEGLAECLRVHIEERSMTPEAELVDQGLTAVILVRDDRPSTRQRFSIGHELAHWALRAPALESATTRQAAEAFRSKEVMANTVAGALLMPRRWLLRRFPDALVILRTTPHDASHAATLDRDRLELVHSVADAAQVSLEAALVRLRDVFGWTHTLLHWTYERPRWVFDSQAGVKPWEQGLVWPSRQAGHVLSALAVDAAWSGVSPFIRTRQLPMRVRSDDGQYEVAILMRGDEAFALLHLDQPAVPGAGDYGLSA